MSSSPGERTELLQKKEQTPALIRLLYYSSAIHFVGYITVFLCEHYCVQPHKITADIDEAYQ